MLEMAREEASKRGVSQVRFERRDVEALGTDEAKFDAALCALGLMYVPEPLNALAEMVRTLKPGGRAVAAVWGERKRCGWADIFPVVDARVSSEVCPMFFQLGTSNVLELKFEKAGLAEVVLERLDTVLHYESGEDACGAAFAGGPVALAYSRFDKKTRIEVHAEYLATIESFRDGDRYAVPGEFVVVRGTKPA